MKAPPLEWLLDAASARAMDTAIQFGAEAWTYSELARRSLRMATLLSEYGLKSGSRVALVLRTGPGYVTSILGSMALGATVVPINPLYGSRELVFHLRSNAVSGIVTEPSHARICAAACKEVDPDAPVLIFGTSDVGTDITPMIDVATPSDAVEVEADDICLVLHTAGSTGRAKLVPRTHAQLRAECDSLAGTIQTSSSDVIFGMLPLHHCHGLFNCLFAALRAQCRLCLLTDPRPLLLIRNAVVETIGKERVTIIPSIPFQLEQLLLAEGDVDFSTVRLCFIGGAALKEHTFRHFRERFGIGIRQQYGCTEAGAVTLNLADDLDATWNSAGKPLNGVQVSIVDPDASGEGEIVVSSAALTSGYEGKNSLNRDLFDENGFRTGDLGRIDVEGNLYVTQRRPIYIDVAGHKVDSQEVEDLLREHPDVDDVIVVGIDGPPAAMKAVIVSSSAPEVAELRDFCRQRVASYKVPSVFEFRDQIPRDAMGKILRKELI